MTETPGPYLSAEFGDFRLEPARRRLLRANGQPVEIPSKAFDALAYLVANAGRPIGRSELTSALWPRAIVEDNSLSKLIVALRRALEETEQRRYIATLPGRGYQFVADVRRFGPPAHTDAAAQAPASSQLAVAQTRARRGFGPPLGALAIACVGVAAFASLWLLDENESAIADGGSLGSQVRVTPITADFGYELAPSLSPDGESVAFSWDGERGNRDLFVMRIGGSGRHPLTNAVEPDRFPAWSPDGANIAFLREIGADTFALMLVPAAGGRERALQTLRFRPTGVWASPLLAWTNASDAVIYTSRSSDRSDSPYHLYELTLASGERRQLTAGQGVYDTSPAVSADGRWLAFVRHGSAEVHGRGTLLLQPLSRDAATVEPTVVPMPEREAGTASAYAIHSPSWSPDGRFLAFVLGTHLFEWQVGAPTPRLVYADAGRLGGVTLTGDVSALTLVWRRGRPRAVIGSVERSADIFVLPLAAAAQVASGPPLPRFVSSLGDAHPRFSPDGGRVAFVSSRDGLPDLWVAAANGTAPRRVTDLRLPIVGFPRWSPDGRRIAFHAGEAPRRHIYFVEPDAGVPERIAEGCCLEWSKDGAYIYVTDFVTEHVISRVRLADGHRETLFSGGFPGLSFDGSMLMYGKVGETNLYSRSVEGDIRSNPETLLLTDAAYPSATAATADGFFYLRYSPASERGQIRFYDYATRQARAVADVPAGVAELITLSPDGTELMFTAPSDSGADLWMVEFGEPP